MGLCKIKLLTGEVCRKQDCVVLSPERIVYSQHLKMRPLAITDNATNAITASFKWTSDEFSEAQRSHAASQLRPWLRYAFLSIVVLVSAGTVLLTLTKPLTADSIIQLVIVGGSCALLLASGLFKGRNFKGHWKRGQLKERDVMYRFTPDALLLEDELSSASIRWQAFVKVLEAERGFLFYSQAAMFHWVPFHAFEDQQDIERVRKYIVQSEVPLKSLNVPAPVE